LADSFTGFLSYLRGFRTVSLPDFPARPLSRAESSCTPLLGLRSCVLLSKRSMQRGRPGSFRVCEACGRMERLSVEKIEACC
jgi:hypothetical protein